jgi:hypothetical protein
MVSSNPNSNDATPFIIIIDIDRDIFALNLLLVALALAVAGIVYLVSLLSSMSAIGLPLSSQLPIA